MLFQGKLIQIIDFNCAYNAFSMAVGALKIPNFPTGILAFPRAEIDDGSARIYKAKSNAFSRKVERNH